MTSLSVVVEFFRFWKRFRTELGPKMYFICLSIIILHFAMVSAEKGPVNETISAAKYDNPNYIRDRYRDSINRPLLPDSWNSRLNQPYHPAWMDYCDPYHCNDYHKPACGLNRMTMKFRWFQSGCHIALHNKCSYHRGTPKFDTIEPKFCTMYVMYLRMRCPAECDIEDREPTCGVSVVDNHIVLFKNKCALDNANCRSGSFQEYEEVDMRICALFV